MINNTTIKNEYTTTGNLQTVYPITFEGATDNNGSPMLRVVLTYASDSNYKILRYNIDYELVFEEVAPDLDESLNTPIVQGIKLLDADDATYGNHLDIERSTPLVQGIDFQVGRIDPEQVERGFDLSVLRDQELKGDIGNLKDYVDAQDNVIREIADDANEKSDAAVETANGAKETAEDAAELVGTFDDRITQNTEDIASIVAGGNIDGVTIVANENNKWEVQAVKNRNTEEESTHVIYDWVGTQAEYEEQDVANQHPDWLCFITDDLIDINATYIFEQAETATTWNVVHHLNKYPSVTVVDSAGTTVDCTVIYINSNECELRFNAAFKGTAYLN